MLLSLLLALASAPASAHAVPPPLGEVAHTGPAAILQEMVQAFDRRDLDGFMACYADDPEVTYVSEGKIFVGQAEIRREMDQFFSGPPQRLVFNALKVRQLSRNQALVVVRPQLISATGEPSFQAVSTLLFVREGGRWRIMLDHTD